MHAIDERDLIRRAQEGEREAFAELYDRHYLAIYNYFYYRLGDRETAEDLTADLFVRMVEKIDRYRDRGRPFLAWLYTIARNLLTDHYRRRRGEAVPLDDLPLSDGKNPPTEVEHRLAVDCLHRALRHLTADQQQVIINRFLEKRSINKVAGLLGKTEGAVKAMQHRALAALRRAIEKEGCYEP